MDNKEIRYQSTEFRFAEEDDKRTLRGYAAKFNEMSQNLNGFREKINPGAFSSSIDNDVRAFWNHQSDMLPLGRTKSETLRLKEDEVGLAFELDLPDTQHGRDLAVSIKRGDVDGVSFGFMVRDDEWDASGNIRTLKDIDLVEISPVNWAAYSNSDFELALRSKDKWLEEQSKTTHRDLAEKSLQIINAAS